MPGISNCLSNFVLLAFKPRLPSIEAGVEKYIFPFVFQLEIVVVIDVVVVINVVVVFVVKLTCLEHELSQETNF